MLFSATAFFTSIYYNKALYNLPRILNLLSQHSCEDHLNILDESVVTIVIAIQSYLVGINDIVIVPDRNFQIGHSGEFMSIGESD